MGGENFAVHILKASGAFCYLHGPATIKPTCSEECMCMAKWGMQTMTLSSKKSRCLKGLEKAAGE